MNSTANAAAAVVSPIYIPPDTLHSLLTHQSLIHHLHLSLPSATTTIATPPRHHHSLSSSSSSSLLLMPSWSSSYIGVKLVTHFPLNSSLSLPAVHATYTLFTSVSGQPLASLDGTLLTLYRTACTSALASKFLSKPTSNLLAMIGAGALAPHLIKAHLSARPSLKKVIIWNRNIQKAQNLAKQLGDEIEGVCFESNENLEEIVRLADIVSCATNSESPLVRGEWLKEGAHLDLVGSFKKTMMECDDEAVRRGRVFVDCEAAVEEAGELVGAVERGVIGKGDIVGNLVELIVGEKVGRRSEEEEITVFKSVGSAAVDLLTAQLVYETYLKNKV